MKFITDPIVKTAKDLAALSSRLIEDGVGHLKSSIGAIPIFAGTKAYVAEEGFGADETHYFLIPFRPAERGYAIATSRVLPEGTGPENDLPKRRVFHLPAGVDEAVLEDLLREQIADEERDKADAESDIADRLDAIAREIDQKANIVTGGLLVIGGAVAIANPVVGAGIAAKALFPSLGAILSREGMKKFGRFLRRKKAKGIDKDAKRQAAKEVKRLKPETHSNPLLSRLEEAVSTRREGHDPALETIAAPEDSAAMRVQSITAEAILNTYGEVLEEWPESAAESHLHGTDVGWLRSLGDFVAERNQG